MSMFTEELHAEIVTSASERRYFSSVESEVTVSGGNEETAIAYRVEDYPGSTGIGYGLPWYAKYGYRSSNKKRIVGKSFSKALQLEVQEIREAAIIVLKSIEKGIVDFELQRFQLDHLPELYPVKVDDGSFLIEWIFEDFRIGFSIEPEIEESSWYLVSKNSLGATNAEGIIFLDNQLKAPISWMLKFIVLYS